VTEARKLAVHHQAEGGAELTTTAKRFSPSAILCRDTKWRSVKYEEVYLHAYRDGREAQQRLRAYFETYNGRRLHQALNYRTPDEVYFGANLVPAALAA